MSEIIWEEWKKYLVNEFEQRSKIISSMGGRFSSKQKSFIALFLLTEGVDKTPVNVLGEIMNRIKGENGGMAHHDGASSSENRQNGDVSMAGHLFGMIESTDNPYRYFSEVYQLLKPEGQMLLTSIKTQNINSKNNLSRSQNSYPGNQEMKFQFGDLYGQYFGLFDIDIAFLQNQAKKTDWRFNIIHQQEEEGYSVLFTYKMSS